MGDADINIEPDAIRRLVEILNSNGVPCELEIMPCVRHEYPQGFDAVVERALSFIS